MYRIFSENPYLLVFTDTNECASYPCQYGGTCNNYVNYWTCSCATGYSGTYCETASEVTVLSNSLFIT